MRRLANGSRRIIVSYGQNDLAEDGVGDGETRHDHGDHGHELDEDVQRGA